jgi:hypothetical protein
VLQINVFWLVETVLQAFGSESHEMFQLSWKALQERFTICGIDFLKNFGVISTPCFHGIVYHAIAHGVI